MLPASGEETVRKADHFLFGLSAVDERAHVPRSC